MPILEIFDLIIVTYVNLKLYLMTGFMGECGGGGQVV